MCLFRHGPPSGLRSCIVERDLSREVVAVNRFLALFVTLGLLLTACGGDGGTGGGNGAEEEEGGSIRVALGDIESIETLALFIALERVRERGVDVQLNELADEDIANQAVVGGQADVGLGAPYSLIEGSGAPIRIICQLQKALFFPVADEADYPNWQAMDGETLTVHSRGSTTEAMAKLIEQTEGIEFGEISFVAGSEVRATALLRGNVKATILDIPNKNYVLGQEPGRFHVLPVPEMRASDETMFGNVEWLQQNEETVQILLEEILTVWRSINEDPSFVAEERERLGLLPDIPADLEEELLPYYEQAGEEGLLTEDCGGTEAAEEDFEFYSLAGQLEDDPESLQVEDFWHLDPLEQALETMEEGTG
ncbi:MAG: ABC transporter substrate-binding protein [Actinobacteria bacterium]|nr:ABC transporter substrate-binding protein [Actinomycetota bacterium]